MLEIKEVCNTLNVYQLLQTTTINLDKGMVYGIISDKEEVADSFVAALLGIDPISGLMIQYDNLNIEEINKNEYRKKIGCSLRGDYLLDNLSAIENIMLVMNCEEVTQEHKEFVTQYISKLLYQYGIDKERIKQPVSTFNDSERKIVEIVRVLSKNPEIIVVDQLSLVEDNMRERLVDQLRRYAITNKKCLILLDHTSDLEEYTDELWILERKRSGHIKVSQ